MLWVDQRLTHTDHQINARIAPAFYAVLDHDAPSAALQTALHELTAAADAQGPFFLGEDLSLVDVHLAPFALRLSRILGPLRGWTTAPSGTRWQRWVDALEADKNVEATTSGRQLYLETTDLLLRRQTQDTGVGGGVPGGGGAEPGLVSGPAPAPGT